MEWNEMVCKFEGEEKKSKLTIEERTKAYMYIAIYS